MKTEIKYPLKARRGVSGVWIEDQNEVTVCNFSPLLVEEAEGIIFDLAEEMAFAWNEAKAKDQAPWTDALRAQLAEERKQ